MAVRKPFVLNCVPMETIDQGGYSSREFRNVDWSGSDLARIEFDGCSFFRCNFSETVLDGALFDACRFEECNLSNPIIKAARFIDAAFDKCKLMGVNFFSCDQSLMDAEFLGCAMTACNFSGLSMKKSVFRLCTIKDSSFQDAFLQDADFSESIFSDTLFHNCDLQKASFYKARGYAIDPRVNKIQKAIFSVPDVLALVENFGIIIRD